MRNVFTALLATTLLSGAAYAQSGVATASGSTLTTKDGVAVQSTHSVPQVMAQVEKPVAKPPVKKAPKKKRPAAKKAPVKKPAVVEPVVEPKPVAAPVVAPTAPVKLAPTAPVAPARTY